MKFILLAIVILVAAFEAQGQCDFRKRFCHLSFRYSVKLRFARSVSQLGSPVFSENFYRFFIFWNLKISIKILKIPYFLNFLKFLKKFSKKFEKISLLLLECTSSVKFNAMFDGSMGTASCSSGGDLSGRCSGCCEAWALSMNQPKVSHKEQC